MTNQTIILLEEISDNLNETLNKLHNYMDKISEKHPDWNKLDEKQASIGHACLDIEELIN